MEPQTPTADPRPIDVDKIMSQCSFTSTSYVRSATAIVADIQVQATKPATTGPSGTATTDNASPSDDSTDAGVGMTASLVMAAAGAGLAVFLLL